jgi:hypothetical protein
VPERQGPVPHQLQRVPELSSSSLISPFGGRMPCQRQTADLISRSPQRRSRGWEGATSIQGDYLRQRHQCTPPRPGSIPCARDSPAIEKPGCTALRILHRTKEDSRWAFLGYGGRVARPQRCFCRFWRAPTQHLLRKAPAERPARRAP